MRSLRHFLDDVGKTGDCLQHVLFDVVRGGTVLVLGGPTTISSMSAVIPGEPGTVSIFSMSTLTPRGPGIVYSNTMDTDSALAQFLFRRSGEKINFSSKVFCNCMPWESVRFVLDS